MDDRLRRLEAELKEARAKVEDAGSNVKRLTLIMSLFLLTLIALVVAAAVATDIFKVEYNGTTRMTVSQLGEVAISEDPAAAEAALKIVSASAARGDLKFTVRSADPTTPQVGDLWFNSIEQKFKFYDGFKRTISIVFVNDLTQVVDDGNTVNNNDGTRGAGLSAGADDPTWTQNAKMSGSALAFDGLNDFVNIAHQDSQIIGNGSMTAEAWVNTAATDQIGGIIAKRQPAGNYEQFSMSIAGVWNSSSAGKKITAMFRESGAIQRTAITMSDIVDGAWHHVVAVMDKANDRIDIYIDGNSVAVDRSAGAGGWPTVDNTDPLTIGNANATSYLYGIIDEVAIWNVALTPAQIGARWNGGAGAELVGNEAGLVSVWHMNDPK